MSREMWESLESSSHFTPGLLIARLISDPSHQEGPQINPSSPPFSELRSYL